MPPSIFLRGQLYWAAVPYLPEKPYTYLVVAPVHSLKAEDEARLRRVNYAADLVLESGEGGLPQPSVIFLNQLRTFHKNLAENLIGQLPAHRIEEMDARLAFCLGLL